MNNSINWRTPFLISALLVTGLLFGCASTTQVEPDNAASSGNVSNSLEQSSATASHTPTATTTSTPAPTSSLTPTTAATVTSVTTTQPTSTSLPPTNTPPPDPTSTSSPPEPTTPPEDNPGSGGSAEQGLEVFKGQFCGICHQLEAAGTAGLFGPPHDGVGLMAAERIQDPDYTGTATTAAEYIRESILYPEIYLVSGFEYSRHPMPAYTHLTEIEVEALVQFLLQQE